MTVAIWSPGRKRAEKRASSSGSPKCKKRPPLHLPTAVLVRSGKRLPQCLNPRPHAMADGTGVARVRRGLSLALPLACLCLALPARSDAAIDLFRWGADDINAPAAWNLSTGAGVQVAVVDTGVMSAHEELRGRV